MKAKAKNSPVYGMLQVIIERASQFKNDISCVRTRLKYYAHQKKKRKNIKRAVNSMDDCFDFMSEPLYGFRTQITTKKSCLDRTCDMVDNTSQRRQSGDEFSSEAPPDCRIIQNQCTENIS